MSDTTIGFDQTEEELLTTGKVKAGNLTLWFCTAVTCPGP